MKRVTGIGGIFFKAKDPEKLKAWYRTHLGIESEAWGAVFNWRDDPGSADAATAWSVFSEESKHFEPSEKAFMINYRVANLDELLQQLRADGVDVDPKSGEPSDFGKFGWIMDPEGNRIELWEPPASAA
ncbi:MAG TPA: VOC family protein [Pyrinomonadaceae bacterium]|nr:VOC family protein [Pyrinomonadaceae bacterium]